jgi:hypothetical protein
MGLIKTIIYLRGGIRNLQVAKIVFLYYIHMLSQAEAKGYHLI